LYCERARYPYVLRIDDREKPTVHIASAIFCSGANNRQRFVCCIAIIIYDIDITSISMSSTISRPQCKFGNLILKRTIPSAAKRDGNPQLRIAYRIIPPIAHDSSQYTTSHPAPLPLLVIHGGPSLPSEYLTPLMLNRTIIFWDQLGCGWSSIPREDEWYGITQMSSDLEELVCHLRDQWDIHQFHLLGHSLGGAIGFEYLKRQIAKIQDVNAVADDEMPQCLSFILSNASTNFALSSSEQHRLFQEFNVKILQTQMPSKQQQTQNKLSIQDQFFQTHICRTSAKPKELELALNRRGKNWSANDYIAIPLDIESDADAKSIQQFPQTLIIRGQHDFVTEGCTRGWKDLLASPQQDGRTELSEVILEDCAHYPHFEQPEKYSSLIEEFCSRVESM